ncbi:winged helix domain-containing protein, partial [Legionella pneumophila]
LWDSLGDYLSEHGLFKSLYQDPDWSTLKSTSEITPKAWDNARQLLRQVLENDKLMQSWFGCFATSLDQSAEQYLPPPLEEDELLGLDEFIKELANYQEIVRDASCRFAYIMSDQESQCHFYVNGKEWDSRGVSTNLLSLVANNRFLSLKELEPYLSHKTNQLFLYELWKLQWLQISHD